MYLPHSVSKKYEDIYSSPSHQSLIILFFVTLKSRQLWWPGYSTSLSALAIPLVLHPSLFPHAMSDYSTRHKLSSTSISLEESSLYSAIFYLKIHNTSNTLSTIPQLHLCTSKLAPEINIHLSYFISKFYREEIYKILKWIYSRITVLISHTITIS